MTDTISHSVAVQEEWSERRLADLRAGDVPLLVLNVVAAGLLVVSGLGLIAILFMAGLRDSSRVAWSGRKLADLRVGDVPWLVANLAAALVVIALLGIGLVFALRAAAHAIGVL